MKNEGTRAERGTAPKTRDAAGTPRSAGGRTAPSRAAELTALRERLYHLAVIVHQRNPCGGAFETCRTVMCAETRRLLVTGEPPKFAMPAIGDLVRRLRWPRK